MGSIYLWFFGIDFSGVAFTLVPPVKPDSPVDEDKEDVTEAVFLFSRTEISSGAGGSSASDWLITRGFGFSYFIFNNSLSNVTTNFSYTYVSWY